MEKFCLKVRKDDVGFLKRMIDFVKEEVLVVIVEFFQFYLEFVEEFKKQFNDEEILLQFFLIRFMIVGGNVLSFIFDYEFIFFYRYCRQYLSFWGLFFILIC